jgi:hypothetical protein
MIFFLLFTKYCLVDQENETNIGGACDESEEGAKSTGYRRSQYFTTLNSIRRPCDYLINPYPANVENRVSS